MINQYTNGEKNDLNTSEMVMLHLMKINGRLCSMLLKDSHSLKSMLAVICEKPTKISNFLKFFFFLTIYSKLFYTLLRSKQDV